MLLTSEYRSEVEWNVELSSSGEAQHNWTIRLFDFSKKIKTADESLSIILPPGCPFSDFKIKVNDKTPSDADGYDVNSSKFVLDFETIKQLLGSSSPDIIKISYKEGGGVIRGLTHDFQKVTLSKFKPQLKATWISIKVTLPKLKGIRYKFLRRFMSLRKKEKKGLYDIILLRGLDTRNVDYSKGEIVHQVNQGNFPQTFEVYYRTIGEIHLGSVILGFIATVILGVVVNFMWGLINGLLGGG